MYHGTSSASGENGAPQWHYQEKDVPAQLMKGQDENLGGCQEICSNIKGALYSLHVTTIFHILYMRLWGRKTRWKLFLMKKTSKVP